MVKIVYKILSGCKCLSIKMVVTFFLSLHLDFIAYAQDIQFSQFYANMLYLNPAFAGSAFQTRAIFHERLQWPGLDAKYITTSFSLDHCIEKYNSGIGILLLKDWQGANTLNSTEAAAQYAYEANISRLFSLRAGIEAKYVSRNINYNHLTLPDQYANNGFKDNQTQEAFGNTRVQYADLSAGGVLYSDHVWLGIASSHLNTPDQSFYTGQETSRLPVKIDVCSGYKWYLERKENSGHLDGSKEISVTPTAHYKWQGKSDQVDLGIYGLYNHVIIGCWYRGIPFLKRYRTGLQNNESMVALLGWKIHQLSISYSYDTTVSKLAQAKTGGSHELNVTYVWQYPKNKKRRLMKWLPCPDFTK